MGIIVINSDFLILVAIILISSAVIDGLWEAWKERND